MNIFVLSEEPDVAAFQLCNKHASRMPLESMGMLSFAFDDGDFPIDNSHSNRHYVHPASIWARESQENFNWLLSHAKAQCAEYTRRYKREHDSEKHIKWSEQNQDKIKFKVRGLTPFARCFSSFKSELDKNIKDTVLAYQEFYKLDKPFARWPSLSEIPDWWVEKSEKYVDKNFINGNYTKR